MSPTEHIERLSLIVRRELRRVEEDRDAIPDCIPIEDMRGGCEEMRDRAIALLEEIERTNERLQRRQLAMRVA